MNRNQFIDRFISNLSNAILHKILEKAIEQIEIAKRYNKEILNSWEIAKRYREKINPINPPLQEKDVLEIRRKITNRVKNELQIRISKGYKNIDINLVEDFVEKALKEQKII